MAFSDCIDFSADMPAITIRNDAPENLRGYLFAEVLSYGISLKWIRDLLCRVAMLSPDSNNWGENDFMKGEIREKLDECKWFFLYDFIEQFSCGLPVDRRAIFEGNVNKFFIVNGIGWSLQNGKILYRGDKTFESAIKDSVAVLDSIETPTSANEMKEALIDISRRPEPDLTGAIQHSVAALECLARNITGQASDTLGKIISQNPQIVPEPLNTVISKLFGFASIKGRHLKEGNIPTIEEAEFVVHTAASLCTFLVKLNK